jgi:uncharacterized protein (TIGR03086 family)
MSYAEPADFTRAAGAVDAVLAAISDDLWGDPTPCAEWTVEQVTDHLIEVNHRFAASLGASGTDPGSGTPRERYLGSTRQLQHALESAESSSTVRSRLALRISDLLVHGWDLAMATGVAVEVPDDVVAPALTFTAAHAGALRRSGQFGPSQPVHAGAPILDQLAALAGRTVASPQRP